MLNAKIKIISVAASIALLHGCGGGGAGGGVAASPAPTPFTSYGAVVNPSTYKMSGSSQEAIYGFNTGNGIIHTMGPPTAFAGGASVTATVDATGVMTALTATSALGTSISLNAVNGDVIGASIPGTNIVAGYSANGQRKILRPNHATLAPAWNYQTFGAWATTAGTGIGNIGVITAGAETAGAAVPAVGAFTFNGVAAGLYADSAGLPFFVTSTMSAVTNFAARSIAFATTGTGTTTDFIVVTPKPSLDMAGTLSYAAGTNQFTGAVTTVGGGVGNAAMTGDATGKFYGPAAQEIGGTFGVTGGGTTIYMGGFGGIR